MSRIKELEGYTEKELIEIGRNYLTAFSSLMFDDYISLKIALSIFGIKLSYPLVVHGQFLVQDIYDPSGYLLVKLSPNIRETLWAGDKYCIIDTFSQ